MSGSINILSNFYNRAIKDTKVGRLETDNITILINYSSYYNGVVNPNFCFEIISKDLTKESYFPIFCYMYNTEMFVILDKSGNRLKITKSELFDTPLEILVLSYGKFFLDEYMIARINSFGNNFNVSDLDVLWS